MIATLQDVAVILSVWIDGNPLIGHVHVKRNTDGRLGLTILSNKYCYLHTYRELIIDSPYCTKR
ncbi:hypothetical protein AXF42_Ash002714 [Apostasia shenzhenica]|uniref:Uncharacterized protein n=1 Tax=Apostasia shenzhenica TaxID=1088818 RepID=A0A2I0A725_9ASPA|nr:hypothetical protein AXF42_Ash002714 [Apostasia shenzhenica]